MNRLNRIYKALQELRQEALHKAVEQSAHRYVDGGHIKGNVFTTLEHIHKT
jgi:hypothetical protein